MKNNISYTYHLIDPRNDLPFYIGKGKGNRMFDHENCVKSGKIPNGNLYLYRKIKKILSVKTPIIYNKVLENVEEGCAFIQEIFDIQFCKDNGIKICNLTDGGDGLYNPSNIVRNKMRYKKSNEHKLKLSESHKGKKCYWYGRKMSKMIREKMSNSHRGHTHSKKTRKKMSLKKSGKTWEEIYGKIIANRLRIGLKNRHKLGIMKSNKITVL